MNAGKAHVMLIYIVLADAAAMSLAPLLSAPPAVQFHVAATSIALVAGAVQLIRKRRGALHRTLGWTFVVARAAAALSSFLIHNSRGLFGLFSPIHLLSILTLVMLPLAIWYARRPTCAGTGSWWRACSGWGWSFPVR
jgi:uncharacterized membrane protein